MSNQSNRWRAALEFDFDLHAQQRAQSQLLQQQSQQQQQQQQLQRQLVQQQSHIEESALPQDEYQFDCACEELQDDDDENDDADLECSSEEDSNNEVEDRQLIRINTAPPRPLTDLEEFKRSQEFLLLEQAVVCSQHLVQKHYQKYDLDSTNGQKACKRYLQIVERLSAAFAIQTAPRQYRNSFSKAYKILYKDGQLCYLTEILDSAQEGFPFLWVNGEKYVFSQNVLEDGQKLLSTFFKMQHIMRNSYSRACFENSVNYSSSSIRSDLISSLEQFDAAWVSFEQLYVLELMDIEKKARRFIQKAIDIEQELQSIEIREKIKGRVFFTDSNITNLKRELCKIISCLNSVANVDGKGRDDLNFEILQESEGILRRITKDQSQAVRSLAESIRTSFTNLRVLFRKYSQNVEMVDPQLKNNVDLVEALSEYESAWEKGKAYFLDAAKCTYLIHFSHIIEATALKHKDFKDQVDCRDADIFLNIPCLLVLKGLNNEDKNICPFFLPQLTHPKGNKLNVMFENLKQEFEVWKREHNKHYEFHNVLEQKILNIPLRDFDRHAIAPFLVQVNSILHKIKQLAMELQRNNPVEWNSFFDAALYQAPDEA